MASTPDLPWWIEHPEVLEDVLRRMRARGWVTESVEPDPAAETVTIELSVLPAPAEYLRVVLPPGYPTLPSTVFGPQVLPEHINPTTDLLCLPDEVVDAVDAVDAAIHLYDVGAQGSQHVRALGVDAAEPRPEYIAAIASHAISVACAIPDGDYGLATFVGVADDNAVKGTIVNAGGAATTGALVDNVTALAGTTKTHEFVWWRTTDANFPLAPAELMTFWYKNAPADARASAAKYVDRHSRPGKKGKGRQAVGVHLFGLVVPEEGPAHNEWHDRLIVLVTHRGRVTATPAASFDDIRARMPGTEALATKTVAIAGLGMLGANIALDLARTGVGELRLGDSDRVELGNLVRQPYTYHDIGEQKADALRNHLLRAAPTCAVPPEHLVRERFGRSATRSTTRRWLEGVDLLVMATGDHLAELHLSDLGRDLGIPVVSGWVNLDTWASATLATQWGQSGCRWCLDKRDDLTSQIATPPDGTELYTRGCGHPTFRGDVIDGQIAASIIARTAVDVLLGADREGDLAITTYRSATGRIGPTTSYARVPPDAVCPICSR